MGTDFAPIQQSLPRGVMLNAYPDSVGGTLSDLVSLLKRPELADSFSLLYVLPTFFNSDLDRGFSVIDYGINDVLVSPRDVMELEQLGIGLKLDLILNHLSVASPQFQDLLQHGDASDHQDFFIDWNAFWQDHGTLDDNGVVVPHHRHLDKLFMRKPGLPVLKVGFPDGSERPYWNTFYQQISYQPISAQDFSSVPGLTGEAAGQVAMMVNTALQAGTEPEQLDLDGYRYLGGEVRSLLRQKRRYLGQMDLNARSEKVWAFYEETLETLRGYGAKIIRLDAFAYLHKVPGESNFFNEPGTWDYLERLKGIAGKHDLIIFPEVHAEYGKGLHEKVAGYGYPIYDFFLPGLLIDALDRGTSTHLRRWIDDIQRNGLETINMLGCHDGIPMLDLRGVPSADGYQPGLLGDMEIEAAMQRIIDRGGRVKNLYGADGRKIAYYQVNATYFSALGEDTRKLLLARAIQLFMPGIPQVWYLDLFAGTNDHAAADAGGSAGHKEINRTNLSNADIAERLQWPVVHHQLELIRLRNTCPAFNGMLEVEPGGDTSLRLTWHRGDCRATLDADLRTLAFSISARCADEHSMEIAHP